MSTELRRAFLVLNSVSGIGTVALNRVLEHFGGDPCAVLAAGLRQLSSAGLSTAEAELIAGAGKAMDPIREEDRMKRSGADFMIASDPAFPALLKEISDPPLGLYRKGAFGFDLPCFAIVGTRQATLYGQAMARRFGAELASRGYCIVSGFSRGADTAAHEGALSVGGKTVAVLSTGLDIIFPPENLGLYRRIAESGAVISEFAFGRQASLPSFSMRSRLISGLCRGVLIVETDVSGGAMATARFAGEQGRTLFALPGRIDQSTSGGCNQLIRDGAILVTRVEEIVQELAYR